MCETARDLFRCGRLQESPRRRPHYDDDPYITPDGRFSDDETLFLPLSEDGEHVSRILVFGTFSPGAKP